MGIQIERTNQRGRSIEVIRVNGPAGRRFHLMQKISAKGPPPNAHRPNVAPAEPLPEIRPPVNDSPAARARKARRRLRRLFETAKRAAKGRARLRRADQHELLRSAYAAVRAWREDGIFEEVASELRLEARVDISPRSSPFLLLLRSALPGFDAKRASKAAAALEFAAHDAVSSKRLAGFLALHGGIEGAAHERAGLRATRS